MSTQKSMFQRLNLQLDELRHEINTAARRRLRVHFDIFMLNKEVPSNDPWP